MAIAKALALSVTRLLIAVQPKPLRRLKTCIVLIGFWIAPSAIASAQGIAPVVPENSSSLLQPHTQQLAQSSSQVPPEVASFVLSASESADFSGLPQEILHLGVSPSSRYITVITRTSKWIDYHMVEVRATQIWDIENEQKVSRLFQSEQLIPQSLSPNGRYLFTITEDQETIQIWDIEENKEVFKSQAQVYEVAAFSSDSQYFLSQTSPRDEGRKEIKVWDFIGDQQIANIVINNSQSINLTAISNSQIRNILRKSNQFQISSNGQYIALELNNYYSQDSSQHYDSFFESATAIAWDIESDQEVVRIQQDDYYFGNIIFSPNSQYVAIAAQDGTDQVWDLQTGEEVARMIHSGDVYGGLGARTISFSSDDRHVLSMSSFNIFGEGGNEAKFFLVWDIKTNQELINSPVQDRTYYFNSQFSEDGQNLVAHGIRYDDHDDEPRLFVSTWNVQTGQKIAHIDYDSQVEIFAVLSEFSSDGRYVAAYAHTPYSIMILDAITLQLVFQINRPLGGYLNSFTFDSQYLRTIKSACNPIIPYSDFCDPVDRITVVQLWKLP
jgi:WD40 repeat protein